MRNWGRFLSLGIVLHFVLFFLLGNFNFPFSAHSADYSADFPEPRAHPLPSQLARWQNSNGDYFDRIEPTPLGYLVWSDFPVKVYLEPEGEGDEKATRKWTQAVREAISAWNAYLPLQEVAEKENADIIWLRSRPPIRARIDRENRQLIIPRARTAEAKYEIYLQKSDPPILAHRFRIFLGSHQSERHTLGTARHELGHALGIWGHSPLETDVLYEAQTGNPPPISSRDLNTLKKIYQQPTQLGWQIERNPHQEVHLNVLPDPLKFSR
ncbi:MAG: peptidase [Cyanobacteria bacterium SBLK]|nr:peptidase [Cyanobacteria bacterium SBLK]